MDISKDQEVRHTTFVLRRNKSLQGEIEKYEARLLDYGKDGDDVNASCFSPVVGLGIIKVHFCLCVKDVWYSKHFGFQNAFSAERSSALFTMSCLGRCWTKAKEC